MAAVGVPGVSKGFAANEKVRLGWLGVGGRGSHDLTVMANNNPDARIVAVCELIEKKGRKGQKIVVDAGQCCRSRVAIAFLAAGGAGGPRGLFGFVWLSGDGAWLRSNFR